MIEGIIENEKYSGITDDEVIELIRDGDELALEYIINKYKNLVKVKSRSYFIMGADRDDIVQEGMIGLYKAMRDYNSQKNTNFYCFAELCINRQILTAIKAANRQKHIPLNSYLSLNRNIGDVNDNETYMELLISDEHTNPEHIIIVKEDMNYIENNIEAVLSELECKVLALYLQGKSYFQIAKALNKDEKSIDNALQRVRKKIEKILKNKNKTQ